MKKEQELSYKIIKAGTDFENFQKNIRETPTSSIKKVPKFPKTVIIAVTIHGGYDVNEDKEELDYFSLPKGVTLRTITAAPVGVSYISCRTVDVELIQRIIEGKDEINKLLNQVSDLEFQKVLDYMTNMIASSFHKEEKGRIENLAKKLKATKTKKRKINSYDKAVTDFSVFHSDKIYQTQMYDDTVEVPKKGFQIKYKDILNRRSKNDSEIKILNMPHAPNLADETWFSLDKYKWHHPEEGILANIELENVVKYLSKHGAENIIMLDFSCSNLPDKISDRSTRRIRRKFTEKRKLSIKSKSPSSSSKKTKRNR